MSEPKCEFCKSWEQIAQQHCRDMHYYRGLVVQIGVMFGESAYIAGDGSRPGGVLCAKVPDLVAKLIEEQADLIASMRPSPPSVEG